MGDTVHTPTDAQVEIALAVLAAIVVWDPNLRKEAEKVLLDALKR